MKNELIVRCEKFYREVTCTLTPEDSDILYDCFRIHNNIAHRVGRLSDKYPERPARKITPRTVADRILKEGIGCYVMRDEDSEKLNAVIDLIEFGTLNMSGMNWMLNFLNNQLELVNRRGPAAVLEQPPLRPMVNLAACLYNHWAWMQDGLGMLDVFPRLFGVKQPAEPVAAAPAPAPPAVVAAAEPKPPATKPKPIAAAPKKKSKRKHAA